jgi:hypothetical protein
MTSQIFKNNISNDIFFELMKEICFKNDKYFVYNYESFKKGMYKEIIPNFIEYCKPFYHISKRKYLEQKTTHKSFTTIIRQICNKNKIVYEKKIVYNKSNYIIEYYIFF